MRPGPFRRSSAACRLLSPQYDTEILIIDDSSRDATFEQAYDINAPARRLSPSPSSTIPENQGYGGNQKLGYRYAIENGFDVVALLHGDGQYAPEDCPSLAPLLDGKPTRSSARA